MKIKQYIEFLKLPYTNFKKMSNPSKCQLLFILEIIILFIVVLINRFIIGEYSCLKKIISCIVFLVYFILWCKYYRNLKMKDSNDALYYQILSRYSVKMIFEILLAIHLLMIAGIVIPEDGGMMLFKLIKFITSSVILIEIINFLLKIAGFRPKIADSRPKIAGSRPKITDLVFKIIKCIYIVIFCLFFVFILRKETLMIPIMTFGGYYLINWFASEDSMYYLSSQYGVRITPNIINEHKLRWASKKANMLFILISTNITFGIKITIPVDWKKSIVCKILDILEKMGRPVSDDFFDRGMIISILVILTFAIIYFIIWIILVNINLYRKQILRKIRVKKPRINKR